ncbi:SspB family protein [Maritimibacter fusiformis]|jgi:hypothetical protein|uniref:Stringent starvation protein B n=1 Tax=Maritimibacter fusiformis TaxID=2603819 RepID=A0A5D0RLJ5_9RHOB|nr:ClpXP protease specificity-enhancing factor SspB [Maritimibacter fusiformis]TYB81414.1 hypothetical protein FVF75_09915 [Maritimibacter fusiformis]
MSDDEIDYGNMMHDAMRGLIRDVLARVAKTGLPGEHHFFISFDTGHPDVEIADWLSDRFPADMTIVMQHWFDDLEVDDDGFAVTLNFNDQPERMYVPYDAIRTFVDPSVEFGLRFESQEAENIEKAPEEPRPLREPRKDGEDAPDRAEEASRAAEVVSLDSFRK